jgi:hypothetical protein
VVTRETIATPQVPARCEAAGRVTPIPTLVRRGPLAQLVEQGTFNPKVAGSIPARPTRKYLHAAARPARAHSNPTNEVDGITHYCVANMPGAVPIPSTFAPMPYVLHVADHRTAGAGADNPGLASGVNVAGCKVT